MSGRSRRLATVALGAAALLACSACGGSTAEDTVRGWSDALATRDDAAAAAYFVEQPIIIQGILPLRPSGRAAVERWHATLECAGRIVGMAVEGNRVTATFELHDRPATRCPAPGFLSTLVFNIRDGLILTWEQTPPGWVPEHDE